MKNVCIISVGNCGNQIASLAFDTRQIPSFGINASEKDLELIRSDIPIYIFGNRLGCGKDRNIAKSLVKQEVKTLLQNEEFKKIIEPSDIIFVISSTGGGTGSGMTPVLTDIFKRVYKNKRVITIGVLPTLNDSIGSQRNSIEFLTELNEINNSYLLYDNNKFADLNVNDMMKRVNEEIVEAISIIRGDYCYNTPYGMIDDMDMDKIIQVPGMINVSHVYNFNQKTLEKKSLENLILESIDSNGSCELDRDKIVKRLGVIVNISSNLKEYYNNKFDDIKKVIGEPIDVFEHYYELDDDNDKLNKFITIMSGLSMPDDRIKLILLRIKEAELLLKRKKESSILTNAIEEIGFIDDCTDVYDSTEDSGDSLDDILNKY